MSEIKPLQIVPITVLWLQASYKPLEVGLEEDRINLINIDISTLLTFCHPNRLLNEKQRNDLRKKIDKRLDGMKGKDFDSFYLNSLMNVLFDVVSDIKRPQTHALAIIEDGYHVVMFLRLQFLEGKARRVFFNENPPKEIYVFSERMNCINPYGINQKSSAICYAWFIWQKGFKGDPIVKWI